MSNSLIWIQVKDKPDIRYSDPLADWAKKQFPGLTVFDFDNYSEGFIVDQAIELASRSDQLILLIQATEAGENGNVTRFLNRLLRNNNIKVLAFFHGKNLIIERMIQLHGKIEVIADPETPEQQVSIIKFLER